MKASYETGLSVWHDTARVGRTAETLECGGVYTACCTGSGSCFPTCLTVAGNRAPTSVYVELNGMAGHSHRPHPGKEARKGAVDSVGDSWMRLGAEESEGRKDEEMMEYKGYRAAVTFDDEAGVFHGEVTGARDVIVFQEDRGHRERVRQVRAATEQPVNVRCGSVEMPDSPRAHAA